MLANNNKAIINKLAQNSIKTNKKQYTILLSGFKQISEHTIKWS